MQFTMGIEGPAHPHKGSLEISLETAEAKKTRINLPLHQDEKHARPKPRLI